MKYNTNRDLSIYSKISHEIRTPLTGIMGMVYFLNKTPLTTQQKALLKGILHNTKQLILAEKKIHNLLAEYKA